jgi:predicted  nucleic acid-binding Zn-ribbon protein
MTRGGLFLYSLAVLVTIWLGYRLYMNDRTLKESNMTLKEEVTQLKKEKAKLESQIKAWAESNTHLEHTLMRLEKESKNKDTLLSIYKDKVVNLIQRNNRMLKFNNEKLKEFKPLLDSLILFNLEEITKNDGQSRESATSEQR